jgi:hypothetical protein
MATREATCSCGQLRLEATGEPFAVSMCHCLACQRRTGSAFGLQAGFDSGQVTIAGRHSDYSRISDEADRKEHVFHFCPECGGTVFYTEPTEPDLVVIAVGAFADPSFPPPTESGYGARRHGWVVLPDTIELDDEAWARLRPLYEAGDYAEAADRALDVIDANPENAELLYNVACCESRAGRAGDAIEHLRRAIALAPEQVRALAADDADLDPIRGEPGIETLLG